VFADVAKTPQGLGQLVTPSMPARSAERSLPIRAVRRDGSSPARNLTPWRLACAGHRASDSAA